jgi:hypothetical protein
MSLLQSAELVGTSLHARAGDTRVDGLSWLRCLAAGLEFMVRRLVFMRTTEVLLVRCAGVAGRGRQSSAAVKALTCVSLFVLQKPCLV